MKKLLMGTLLTICIAALALGLFLRFVLDYKGSTEEVVEATPTPTPIPVPTPTPEPTIDPAVFYDTDSLLVVANKVHKLPEGYEPADLTIPNVRATQTWYLREEAANALEEMFEGAAADGITMVLGSAYRSAAYQGQLWNGYAGQYGSERADRISSRAGYSDHQTGLAVDIFQGMGSGLGTDLNETFENTPEGQWLKDNAHRYGWIMRYPKGKEEITGYAYEPWHFRYIGVEYATEIYNVDPFYSFEEFFGVEGGKEYKE